MKLVTDGSPSYVTETKKVEHRPNYRDLDQ